MGKLLISGKILYTSAHRAPSHTVKNQAQPLVDKLQEPRVQVDDIESLAFSPSIQLTAPFQISVPGNLTYDTNPKKSTIKEKWSSF